MNKLFVFLTLLTLPCFAQDTANMAIEYVQRQYLKGRKQTLLAIEEKKIPFKNHTIIQVANPGKPSQFWRVWVGKDGKVQKVVTTEGLHKFLESIKEPLSSVNFDKSDPKASEKFSKILLSYLASTNFSVQCKQQKQIHNCRLGITGQSEKSFANIAINLEANNVKIRN